MRAIPMQNFLPLVARAVLNDYVFKIGVALIDDGTNCRFEVLRIADDGSNDGDGGKWRSGQRASESLLRHHENC